MINRTAREKNSIRGNLGGQCRGSAGVDTALAGDSECSHGSWTSTSFRDEKKGRGRAGSQDLGAPFGGGFRVWGSGFSVLIVRIVVLGGGFS